MIQGTIIKGIAGFYYVKVEGKVYECKARGRFRKENITPLIGDRVMISVVDEIQYNSNEYSQGTVEEILKRTNKLIRPPVANVDQGIVVFAVTYPEIHLDLLDRFLVMVEIEGIKPYIVLNKVDGSNLESYKYIVDGYSKSGYEVVCVSAKEKLNVDRIKEILKDKTSFFAGPSGVGKSTLLNAIQPDLKLQTGEVSVKIKRGKHTTRHVELLPLNQGGYVLDTPGFTSLQFEEIDQNELRHYFPEFGRFEGKCKFNGCSHIHEPGCKVKEALEKGEMFELRYASYVTYYNQLKDIRRW
ncbi:MAG: ribosome small subunit-dependent GTPase A [Cellulosilyticaceae bacterium]